VAEAYKRITDPNVNDDDEEMEVSEEEVSPFEKPTSQLGWAGPRFFVLSRR
jgi:hypothetical protein